MNGDGDMTGHADGLPTVNFDDEASLRSWLEQNHEASSGVWVRVYKKNSGIAGVTFDQLLEQGLCFGWSESMRRPEDHTCYLQRFTPRRTKGTTSQRNLNLVATLIAQGKMTSAGRQALGLAEQ